MKRRFVVCVNNAGYPASLEMRKVYAVLPDAEAEPHGLVRVVDETGEDYLFPADRFEPVEVTKKAEKAFSAAKTRTTVG